MKYVVYLCLVVFLVPLQMVLVHRFAIASVQVDLVLIAVCLIGLQAGEVDAVALGILLGFTQDLFSGGTDWANLWLKPFIGLMAGLASRNVVNLTVPFTLALLIALSIFFGSMMFVVKSLHGPGVDFFAAATRIILPQACYDGVVGVAVFKLLQLGGVGRSRFAMMGYE